MWIPGSEGEIVEAITAGSLVESTTFDAKAALPTKGRPKDLAVGVAATANDGGTLLYGMGEDEHGTPSVLSPLDFAGARERVAQIVRTCISEPPTVEIRAVPTQGDPVRGYLVVAVPRPPERPTWLGRWMEAIRAGSCSVKVCASAFYIEGRLQRWV